MGIAGHAEGQRVRAAHQYNQRMEIIVGLHNLKPRHRGAVATIGSFDGVHQAHQVLLDDVCAKARTLGKASTLITFEPTPREFFNSAAPARLTRFREKITLLARSGLERVICLPFNARTSAAPAQWVAEDFLHDRLGAVHVVVGDDFRFGRGRQGDYAMLKAAGERVGYAVSRLGTLTIDGIRVSSSAVREALSDGNFRLAEKLLGHPYFIMGRVVYGRRLGHQLGTPTANIRLQRYRAALQGVYAVTVDAGLGRPCEGVANIGIRPTVDGKEPLLEVHVFDFEQEIYGRLLTVRFRHKVRDERAFESIDALKAQIGYDVQAARAYFEMRRSHGET